MAWRHTPARGGLNERRHAVKILLRGLAASARYGSALLALSILGGILLPPVAHALRGAVSVVVVGLTTLVLLRVDIPAAIMHLRRPGRLAALIGFQLLVCPVIAWAAVRVFPIDPGIADGVVIFATGATIGAAPAFARMVGLDAELALLSVLLSTILVPLTAPPIAWSLMGVDLAISMGGFAQRLGLVVGLPLVLSLVLRRLVGAARLAPLGPALDGLVVWLLMAFGFGVMDGVLARLMEDPAWILQATLAAGLVTIGLNLATVIAVLPFGATVAATAGMVSGFRNMALYLAVLPVAADKRVALFFGLYQIPLYLSPLVMRPLYRRLLRV